MPAISACFLLMHRILFNDILDTRPIKVHTQYSFQNNHCLRKTNIGSFAFGLIVGLMAILQSLQKGVTLTQKVNRVAPEGCIGFSLLLVNQLPLQKKER